MLLTAAPTRPGQGSRATQAVETMRPWLSSLAAANAISEKHWIAISGHLCWMQRQYPAFHAHIYSLWALASFGHFWHMAIVTYGHLPTYCRWRACVPRTKFSIFWGRPLCCSQLVECIVHAWRGGTYA
jgi:hypothetical protein